MKIKSLLLATLFIIGGNTLLAWGPTGHRVIGQIASSHLSKKAASNVKQVLGNETIAEVGTYMDFIRSDPQYGYLAPWHYATIPDQTVYEKAPEEGDVIAAINQLIKELKSGEFTIGDEAFTLKCLIHLIEDIHQPLHIGNGLDRGGNDYKVEFFWEPSNLHRVWDSDIIDSQQLSYTEYTEWINHPTREEIDAWQLSTLMDWAYESMHYRQQVYKIPENKKLSYQYNFENIHLVNQRLLQAGVRLAGILNQIYG